MHERMLRKSALDRQHENEQAALLQRARKLSPEAVRKLLTKLKTDDPQDRDTYWTLVRHYEYAADIKGLDALRLWYIQHQPNGNIPPGNIDPRLDLIGYQQGKALWREYLRRPATPPGTYLRSAEFLEGGDKSVAELVLLAGRKAYPSDTRWSSAFGRHYAQVLLGSAEPLTDFNVIRVVSEHEKQSPYAHDVRRRLKESRDAAVLAQTAQHLNFWFHPDSSAPCDTSSPALALASDYAARALSLEPESVEARAVKASIDRTQLACRAEQLARMSSSELLGLSNAARLPLTLVEMRTAWIRRDSSQAAAKAHQVLAISGEKVHNALYIDSAFEANLLLGKVALRQGHNQVAVRYLLAAASMPECDQTWRGQFDMNLPRALVDRGERLAVAEFFERIAPKTLRAAQFRRWAADLRAGKNPDLIPTSSFEGCTHDPC